MSSLAALPNGGEPSGSTSVGTADDAAASISAAVFKRLHPASYLSRFLAKGYRPDGRKVHGWREVSINVGSISTANGSALVRMGDTTLVCGIKAEIAEPLSETPGNGYVVPNIDLPALCSPNFKPGPPGPEAQVYSNWLNDLLVSSSTVPLESLSICPGKASWVLYVDVVCINYDGNAFDAAVMALMAALRNTRLPRATYSEEIGQTVCSRSETFPLTLGRIPLSCSFGVFQSYVDFFALTIYSWVSPISSSSSPMPHPAAAFHLSHLSTHLLPDPTAFETPLLATNLSIALDEANVASLVRQEGIGGVVGATGQQLINTAWAMAEERVKELRRVLEEGG